MTWLLVWAVGVVAVDAIVVVRHDDHHVTASRSSSAPSSSASSSSTAATSLPATDSAAGPSSTSVAPATSTTAAAGPATTTAPAQPTETTPNGDVVVAHLSGDGQTSNSAGFHVDGHWQLRWHVEEGNGVAATVDNDDDPNHPVLFAGLTPGDGSTDVGTGCTCTLHLTADGSRYDVLVVDVVG